MVVHAIGFKGEDEFSIEGLLDGIVGEFDKFGAFTVDGFLDVFGKFEEDV